MALTPRENAMAIFYGRQPDYYGDIMEAITLVPDPVMFGDLPPRDGREYRDSWGTVYVWPPTAPGPHPRVTKENAVIPDIERWQEYLKVPSLEGLDFGPAKEVADSVDRREKFVGFMFGGGLFERSHHLMGMQDALMNYLEYPEEMAGVLREICEYKKAYIRLMAEQVHPDIIFYHDDWGSKQNLFLPPRTWRALIKPLQQEISDTIHQCGMIYMHHADCICQPIVEDMVEIGVDIWQGVMTTNNIPELIKKYGGKISFMGGIDSAKIDYEGWTKEVVAKEVKRACDENGKLYFIPSASQGLAVSTGPGVYEATTEAIDAYSKQVF